MMENREDGLAVKLDPATGNMRLLDEGETEQVMNRKQRREMEKLMKKNAPVNPIEKKFDKLGEVKYIKIGVNNFNKQFDATRKAKQIKNEFNGIVDDTIICNVEETNPFNVQDGEIIYPSDCEIRFDREFATLTPVRIDNSCKGMYELICANGMAIYHEMEERADDDYSNIEFVFNKTAKKKNKKKKRK